MKKLPFLMTLLVSCLMISSCVTTSKRGQWMDKRAQARAAGGSTWSQFVIDNLFYMDSYLSYDQQMSDVQSAIPYASPADQQFLAGVKQRMGRDQVAAATVQAQKQQQQSSGSSSFSNYGSGSSSGGSSYSSPSYNQVQKAQQSQDQADFNNYLNSVKYGSSVRPGNPYSN